ncbi:MAG: APC family permease [Candidatus Obscuribacterales bacterium]|nr:APC family permease [Candidatus Obscuribacterales bacterium]
MFSRHSVSSQSTEEQHASWWNVMCLTGVDYFSSLGYQPGIAFLAAGILSPIATLVVVIVTMFGLVPLYYRVAHESPHGQGSLAMLEHLLPGWRGKLLILVLLGFAATDFVITMTLSAADAAAHIAENPILSQVGNDKLNITSALLIILGAIFLKGFREAIGLSVVLVVFYLGANSVVLCRSLFELIMNPGLIVDWQVKLLSTYKSIPSIVGISLLVFPKLALGMSGFETGVAVMPLVKGLPDDVEENPTGRVKNTRKLLLTSAVIMAVGLILSSITTTLLIPASQFQTGGSANGRALAYLAHQHFGVAFGTAYDIGTILILWFAGASAMAGLLNLVPRYLPRYGMAPQWSLARRPLVTAFTAISLIVTYLFHADVDAQAGAYATGVLVLFASSAFAVMLSSWKEGTTKRILFVTIFLVFLYTSIANMIERPEGLHIASVFIGAILIISLISRAVRSVEIRIQSVEFDQAATNLVQDCLKNTAELCLLAHRPDGSSYAKKEMETRKVHKLTEAEATFIFLELNLSDPSDFEDECLFVTGHTVAGYKVLRAVTPAVPNAIAAVLMHLRESTGTIPHAYFGWTEGNPIGVFFKYVFLGEGEIGAVTREILRENEPDAERRPKIIIG